MKKTVLKIAAAVLSVVSVLSMAGCKTKEKEVYNVGICQLVKSEKKNWRVKKEKENVAIFRL